MINNDDEDPNFARNFEDATNYILFAAVAYMFVLKQCRKLANDIILMILGTMIRIILM